MIGRPRPVPAGTCGASTAHSASLVSTGSAVACWSGGDRRGWPGAMLWRSRRRGIQTGLGLRSSSYRLSHLRSYRRPFLMPPRHAAPEHGHRSARAHRLPETLIYQGLIDVDSGDPERSHARTGRIRRPAPLTTSNSGTDAHVGMSAESRMSLRTELPAANRISGRYDDGSLTARTSSNRTLRYSKWRHRHGRQQQLRVPTP